MTTIAERARAAVPYGLPTVDLHRILVNFALDPGSPEFKAPLNAINHTRGLADSSDVSVVAMNVDTPYSWAWLDLRSGPVVLAMPPHPADRYMSAQIVDLYTKILGYVSPRTFGNDGGAYAVRGPVGGIPGDGVTAVFECPTDLALVLIRTQLFDDEDLAAVAALQDQVSVTALEADRQLTGATADLAERLHLSDATVKIHITTARRSAGRADPLARCSASRARCLALRTGTGTPPSPASNSPKNLTCTRPPYDHRRRPHLSSLRPR